MLQPEVLDIDSDRPDLGKEASELAGNVVNENDESREVLRDAVLSRDARDPGVAARQRLCDNTERTGRGRCGERSDDAVEVVAIALKDANDLFRIRTENLNPQLWLAARDAGRITKALTGETNGSITRIHKAGSEKRRNNLGNVRHQRDAAVMLGSIQLNRCSPEVESKRLEYGIGRSTVGDVIVIGNDPR